MGYPQVGNNSSSIVAATNIILLVFEDIIELTTRFTKQKYTFTIRTTVEKNETAFLKK